MHFAYSTGVLCLRNHPILDEVVQHESIPHAYIIISLWEWGGDASTHPIQQTKQKVEDGPTLFSNQIEHPICMFICPICYWNDIDALETIHVCNVTSFTGRSRNQPHLFLLLCLKIGWHTEALSQTFLKSDILFITLFQAVFQEYESESYKKLIADIEAQPSIAVQNVLKSFLHKIYKRQK